MLTVIYPAGRAGGDEREGTLVIDTFNKLGGFLKNGEVGGEIGVEHIVEAETAQSRNHLTLNIGADGHVEYFTECGTGSGSRLNDDALCGIGKSRPNFIRLILLVESAGGAGNDALSAGNAGDGVQRSVEGAADMGVEAALIYADDRSVL